MWPASRSGAGAGSTLHGDERERRDPAFGRPRGDEVRRGQLRRAVICCDEAGVGPGEARVDLEARAEPARCGEAG